MSETQAVERTATYIHLTGEPIAWTMEVEPGLVLVDVDAEGRAIGIETFNGPLDLVSAVEIICAARFDNPNN